MQINIKGQLPINIKLLKNNLISIPIDFRTNLGWKEGDILEVYGTPNGLFVRKKEVNKNV